ncbi:MAG TPA: ABC transporter ATP-binding protein [Longimicrobiales bacterium]|nr:ABC transporter ATP-binding protein [Longimicrobiales bacterium]
MIGPAIRRRLPANLDLSPLRQGLVLVLQSGRRWLVAQIALMVLQSAIPLLALYLLKEIVDTVAAGLTAGDGASRLGFLVVLAGGVAILGAALRSLSALVTEVQSLRLSDHVQEILYRKSVEVDLEFYESTEYHDALLRAQAEAPVRPQRVVAAITQVGQAGLSLLAVTGLLLAFHWILTVALLAAAIPGLFVRTRFSARLYRWTRNRTQIERVTRYFTTLLTSIDYAKEMRVFGLGDEFRARHRRLRQQVRRERLQLTTRQRMQELAAQTLTVTAVFAAMFFIAQRALAGEISVGDVVMYFGAFQRAQDFFGEVLRGMANLYENNLFLADFVRFLGLQPTVVDPAQPRPFPSPLVTGIEFDDVTFRYPGTDQDVLKNVTFTIAPGEHVALVGENGSGKTTLVKLLCRLYDPATGAVRVDGVDLREISVDDLRSHFAIVFQDYAKFYLTARENIWLGNVSVPVDSDAIIEAARRTGADEVIRALPNGYDTLLGRQFENGVDLSIGQWQKLALARAFLRQTPIIILDEPSAALDPRAEAAVFDRFDELARDRTAIFISHRLSTVRRADRILVMVDGRIAEAGAHEDLVERAGVYASLFETQARHYR